MGGIGSGKKMPETRKVAIIADRKAGMTLGKVAEKYGVTRQRVHQICVNCVPRRVSISSIYLIKRKKRLGQPLTSEEVIQLRVHAYSESLDIFRKEYENPCIPSMRDQFPLMIQDCENALFVLLNCSGHETAVSRLSFLELARRGQNARDAMNV